MNENKYKPFFTYKVILTNYNTVVGSKYAIESTSIWYNLEYNIGKGNAFYVGCIMYPDIVQDTQKWIDF